MSLTINCVNFFIFWAWFLLVDKLQLPAVILLSYDSRYELYDTVRFYRLAIRIVRYGTILQYYYLTIYYLVLYIMC
jgi:hypothetical protein